MTELYPFEACSLEQEGHLAWLFALHKTHSSTNNAINDHEHSTFCLKATVATTTVENADFYAFICKKNDCRKSFLRWPHLYMRL